MEKSRSPCIPKEWNINFLKNKSDHQKLTYKDDYKNFYFGIYQFTSDNNDLIITLNYVKKTYKEYLKALFLKIVFIGCTKTDEKDYFIFSGQLDSYVDLIIENAREGDILNFKGFFPRSIVYDPGEPLEWEESLYYIYSENGRLKLERLETPFSDVGYFDAFLPVIAIRKIIQCKYQTLDQFKQVYPTIVGITLPIILKSGSSSETWVTFENHDNKYKYYLTKDFYIYIDKENIHEGQTLDKDKIKHIMNVS